MVGILESTGVGTGWSNMAMLPSAPQVGASLLVGAVVLTAPDALARDDGPRVRAGLAAAFGGAAQTDDRDGGILFGGAEGHLGVQIDDLVGVYLAPRYAAGKLGVGGDREVSFITELLGVSAVVDFTLADRFFVGGGGGLAQYQLNCVVCIGKVLAGGVLHARLGGYPVVSYDTLGARRFGMMVGAEVRTSFLRYGLEDGGSVRVTFVEPSLTVGVEAF